jgi:hypothetical protein
MSTSSISDPVADAIFTRTMGTSRDTAKAIADDIRRIVRQEIHAEFQVNASARVGQST